MATATAGRPPAAAYAGMTEEQVKAAKKEEAKARREKLPKFTIPQGGLKEVGSDYSISKYKRLVREDFASESDYLDFSASELEKRAAKMRQNSNDYRAMGNLKDPKKAKKLLKMHRAFDELRKQLEGDDVDVESLLKTLG